ncbi:MAG: polyprenyl synthetase family protein [Treponema sp.]|jgi:octaprenyl-diphosphate synthase|nr:polyprenyl synthetase family protein [Treponema sp.]
MKEYEAVLETIEAALRDALPPAGDSGFPVNPWYGRVFPGLNLTPALTESLLEPGLDLLNRGGKRWRPLLAHLVCRTLGGGDAALPLLALIEFSHNASLIHDDLEDNAPQRRGKPSIHLLYGGDTAINTGSFFYFLPLAALENWGAAESRDRIWRLWGEHMRFLHLGQSMDIAWHRDPDLIPSIDQYMLMCGLKTGCLARFAALLGAEAAAIAGAPGASALTGLLGEAAQKLGVGFQVLDDVKNLAAGVPGKKRGDDVVEGKKSLPVLLFLSGPGNGDAGNGGAGSGAVRKERAALVRRCFAAAAETGVDAPEVEELIGALTEAGALAEAESRGRALIGEAGAFFAGVAETAGDPRAGKLLAGLAELLR